MLHLLIPSLFVSLSLSEKSCDQCWDEYWSCDWDVQSSAWDKCSAVWEEGSEYAPFDRQCIEQQAEDGIVECYENAGCFEPGNQECWWKMWDLGCSPYKCEAYTICYENTINEQNCDGQLDQCQENCDDSGYDSYGGYDSFDSYNYYDSFDNYNDYGDSYNFDYYDSYPTDYGYSYYYDGPEEWEYAYEEIPECIRNECGDVLDQCASTDSCVQGIENVANSCYNGYEDPAQCMDDTFINVDSNNEGALALCDGDQLCSNDLQGLGECIVNSANYGYCPETDYKALRGVVKLVKHKRSKLLQQQRVKRQRQRRNASRKRPRSQLRQRRQRRKLVVSPKQRGRARRGRQNKVRRDRRVRPRSQLRQNRQRRRNRRQNRRRDAVRARGSRRQLTGYTGGDSWDYQYPSDSYMYDNYGYTDSWDSYNYDDSFDYDPWDSYPYDNSWDYDWNSYPDYDYSWDSYDYGNDYEPYTICGDEEEWEYTYNEIPPCISNNCNVELLTCAGDGICVAAIESIANECDSENDAEIGQCIEDIIINDVEQAKVNEFCDSDTLCMQSFTSLGQCVLNNQCFAENQQYAQKKRVVSLVKSAKSLRRQKTDKLKKREKDRQSREKQKRLAFRKRKLNELKKREFNQQKRKLAQKRREFVARRRAKKQA